MATITLDYSTRNTEAKKALEQLLALGFFKAHAIRKSRRSKSTFLTLGKKDDNFVYFASEQVLAKDWLNKEEEEVWKDL